jgi:hypothetical protein
MEAELRKVAPQGELIVVAPVEATDDPDVNSAVARLRSSGLAAARSLPRE